MEKVSEKWFKSHNWERFEESSVEGDGTIRKHLIYSIHSGKLNARYDRIIYNYPDKKVSRFYMFYAKGCNGFEVVNKISHFNFTTDTIIAALKTVGYDEFGNWIDK